LLARHIYISTSQESEPLPPPPDHVSRRNGTGLSQPPTGPNVTFAMQQSLTRSADKKALCQQASRIWAAMMKVHRHEVAGATGLIERHRQSSPSINGCKTFPVRNTEILVGPNDGGLYKMAVRFNTLPQPQTARRPAEGPQLPRNSAYRATSIKGPIACGTMRIRHDAHRTH